MCRFDNQTIMRQPADGEKSIPTTDGRPAAGPKMIIRPKEGEVDPETVPLLHKAPPPSEVPEWSDGEVMPLIIIENNSGVVIPKTTVGRVPVGSDILLPKSMEINNSEDQGVMSARVRLITERHQKAPKGTERHQKAPKGTERHRKAPKGTERHRKATKMQT